VEFCSGLAAGTSAASIKTRQNPKLVLSNLCNLDHASVFICGMACQMVPKEQPQEQQILGRMPQTRQKG
jgi:hypothetical protein